MSRRAVGFGAGAAAFLLLLLLVRWTSGGDGIGTGPRLHAWSGSACLEMGDGSWPNASESLAPPIVALLGQFEGSDLREPRLARTGPNGGLTSRGFRFWARGVGLSEYGPRGASGLAVDTSGRRLFVPDSHNHRVLVFRLGDDGQVDRREAELVLGQPDFQTTFDDNVARPDIDPIKPDPSADRLLRPTAVEYAQDRQWLFVSDTGQDRVLIFDLSGSLRNGMAASASLGGALTGVGMISAGSAALREPEGLAFDAVRSMLWIADTGNHRVLGYDLSGGLGDPRLEFVLQEHPVAGPFRSPRGLSLAKGGAILYVADTGNHRVVGFEIARGTQGAGPEAELVAVLGQDGPTLNLPNRGRRMSVPEGLRDPHAVLVDDASGRLYVGDSRNHRVLAFDLHDGLPVSARPRFGLGVPDLRMPVPDGLPPATATTMNYPTGIGLVGRSLYVVDRQNNRILVFEPERARTGDAAVAVLGQYYESDLARPSFTQQGPNDGPTSFGLNQADGVSGVAVAEGKPLLAVADAVNGRVLLFDLTADGTPVDPCADRVLGVPDFATIGGQEISRRSIRRPQRLAFSKDGRLLFVTDDQASRVLVYDLDTGVENGIPAHLVLGQPDFNSSAVGDGSTGLNRPRGVAYDDASGRLFVADTNNHRVVVYELQGEASNGMPATLVLTQEGVSEDPDGREGDGVVGMDLPRDLVFDASTARLFVADVGNERILVFDFADGLSDLMRGASLEVSDILDSAGREHEPLGGLSLDARRRILWGIGSNGGWIAGFDVDALAEDSEVGPVVFMTPDEGTHFGGGVAVEPGSGLLYATDGRNIGHRVVGIRPR